MVFLSRMARRFRKLSLMLSIVTVVALAPAATVDATQQLKPDLVLMDVNLPGINGLDATRRILRDSNGVVVVLLLSTYDEEDYASKAAECGASAYIAKSRFDPDRLTAAWATATR